MPEQPKTTRLVTLDYLRGFFITVIIIDHLWRWPNLFQYVTGRGELWVSAAEGFVIISGLLVGYVHGFKKRHQPLLPIAKKLSLRGIMLFAWMVITTLTLVWATWYLPMKGNMAYIPVEKDNWNLLWQNMIHLDYVHSLTHFLYLYAIFLVISPFAIWLLRRSWWWIIVIASGVLWWHGLVFDTEWQQWQVVFFIPAIIGYYLDSILIFIRSLQPRLRHLVRIAPILVMFTTFMWSMQVVFAYEPGVYDDLVFSRDPLSLSSIALSFVWFAGLLSLFQYLLPWLKKTASWILPVFGERSLTAYILHTVPLVACQLLLVNTTGLWINTFITTLCILITWLLLKVPHINKLIPR